MAPTQLAPNERFPGGRFDIDRRGPSPRLLVLDGSDGQAVQVFGGEAPDAWRSEYYGNLWLAERPLLIEYRASLDLA